MEKNEKIRFTIYIILFVVAIACCFLSPFISLALADNIATILQFVVVILLLWESAEYREKIRELKGKLSRLQIRVGELLMAEEENEKLKEEIQELKKTIKNQNISIGMYKHNLKNKSQKSESSDDRG